MAYVHQGLGRLAVINGSAGAAIAHYRQALTILRETGDREAIAMSFEGLATVPISSEQPDSAPLAQRAVRLLGAATALRLTLGSPPPPADRIAHERALPAIRATLGEAAFAAAWAEGEAMTLEQAIDHVLGATGPT